MRRLYDRKPLQFVYAKIERFESITGDSVACCCFFFIIIIVECSRNDAIQAVTHNSARFDLLTASHGDGLKEIDWNWWAAVDVSAYLYQYKSVSFHSGKRFVGILCLIWWKRNAFFALPMKESEAERWRPGHTEWAKERSHANKNTKCKKKTRIRQRWRKTRCWVSVASAHSCAGGINFTLIPPKFRSRHQKIQERLDIHIQCTWLILIGYIQNRAKNCWTLPL